MRHTAEGELAGLPNLLDAEKFEESGISRLDSQESGSVAIPGTGNGKIHVFLSRGHGKSI